MSRDGRKTSLCWDCKQGGVKPPTRELNALVVAEPDPKPDPKPDSYWDWLPADLADKIMALVWPMRRKPMRLRSGMYRDWWDILFDHQLTELERGPKFACGPWLERGGFRPRLWPARRRGCAEQAKWLTAEQKELGIYLYGQGADAWYLFPKHSTPQIAELEASQRSSPLQMDFRSPLSEGGERTVPEQGLGTGPDQLDQHTEQFEEAVWHYEELNDWFHEPAELEVWHYFWLYEKEDWCHSQEVFDAWHVPLRCESRSVWAAEDARFRCEKRAERVGADRAFKRES